MKIIKEEFAGLTAALKKLNKKPVIIFLSIAVLQTISWYLTSRQFYKTILSPSLPDELRNNDLISFIYWFTGDFITLCLIPILLIKVMFKDKVRSYGITLNEKKLGSGVVILSLLIMIPVLWFISSSASFTEQYPMLLQAKESMHSFLVFQVFLILFLFAWEFFFRGFILFGLKEEFGYYAIFIQMIPFVILHNGKPFLETTGAIFGGLFLGMLAFRTGSFIYGFIIHYFILLFIDLFAILRDRAGEFGSGPDSFFRIVSKIF